MVTTTGNAATASIRPPSAERFLLNGISWETYELLSNDLEQSGRRLRLTFDNGDLEIEVPNELHEALKAFIRAIVEAFLFERRVRFAPLSATTWKRRLMAKGIEADECYYIQNAGEIGLGMKIDLDRDPVPDLAIEIEVSSPLIAKLPIYAALGVHEIWHISSSNAVSILILDNDSYRAVEASSAIPYFTTGVLKNYLALRMTMDHFDALDRFRNDLSKIPPTNG